MHRLGKGSPKMEKTQIALVLFDIHNEFDLFKKFIELAKRDNKISITIIVVDSGNPADKKVDTAMYAGGNVKVVQLYERKANLLTDYSSFYAACEKLDPLYKVYKRARLCEEEDVQYGFLNNVLSALKPDVCMYVNIQEFGRVVANVCAAYSIPSICVEYAFSFDTYYMEKRIRFDLRACISEITAQNWIKHKDPTPRHEVIGFCKMDEWHDRLARIEAEPQRRPFDNGRRTVLFVSTWAPNPKSPLLTEKVRIVQYLSDFCYRNGWNLLVKKHPSEFDGLLDNVFSKTQYPGQRLVEHSEMPLFDCMYYSDFICTQNSSAFIETLYLNKPYSYLTTDGENLWANMSYFAREKVVGNFHSMTEYERYLMEHSTEEAYRQLQAEFMNLKGKFLYKTDGRASERLLALAESFIK
jgi:CDP-Glycerol:Poly(glycerophosphate) glycerophosphotransferase